MKRIFIYTLLLVCALTSMRCTEETAAPEPITDPDNAAYNSYWYYTYEALETVDYETLGLAAAADFNPYAVA
ncbi:MAG: hypothetical protein K2O82_02065, partial [Alistipes sp.]|nr:hypothetical protein [Alistipes sp.]